MDNKEIRFELERLYIVIYVTWRLDFPLPAFISLFLSLGRIRYCGACVSRVFIKSRHSRVSRCYILMSLPFPP